MPQTHTRGRERQCVCVKEIDRERERACADSPRPQVNLSESLFTALAEDEPEPPSYHSAHLAHLGVDCMLPALDAAQVHTHSFGLAISPSLCPLSLSLSLSPVLLLALWLRVPLLSASVLFLWFRPSFVGSLSVNVLPFVIICLILTLLHRLRSAPSGSRNSLIRRPRLPLRRSPRWMRGAEPGRQTQRDWRGRKRQGLVSGERRSGSGVFPSIRAGV